MIRKFLNWYSHWPEGCYHSGPARDAVTVIFALSAGGLFLLFVWGIRRLITGVL